jgi:adenine-specific DNA-methyltransferase
MKQITAHDPETKSADVIAGNIQQLMSLFPEAVCEGKLDFDVLKELLGGVVDEREEKYGLNWHGKRRARQLALTPSAGTLRPCPEESVDWGTTRNLMIEGDNLEVLKLLQKSYAGKVKLIYIDPPYNTGKDFVYPDNFQDNIKNYLEVTGQIGDGGKRLSSNTESSGRFHTDWLSMMYPRLKLAKSLLREDGIIFVSIDDHEIQNLKIVLDEIFGEENFLCVVVWRRRQVPDNRNENNVSTDHEYIVGFGKGAAVLNGKAKDLTKYKNPDNDIRGPWMSDNMTGLANALERPNLHYDLINPETGIAYPPSANRGWAYERSTAEKLIAERRILWPASPNGRPRLKRFRDELQNDVTGFSSLQDLGFTTDGTRELEELFGRKVFAFPKPIAVPLMAIRQCTNPTEKDIILDLFAGSGTTGHATFVANLEDSGNRRFILVQLPEPTELVDFATIAELTKERLRRAGSRLREDNPLFSGDYGFRVFKLDSSNINAWDPAPSTFDDTLLRSIDHLKPDRDNDDILYELLLKLGLDLCVPIERRTIADIIVHSVGAGALLVCLTPRISQEEVERLALGIIDWHKQLNPAGESTVVFRDSAFADDVAKTNLAAILQQHGLENVRSL